MAKSQPPEDVPAAVARQYWRALVENAISLIEDAACLVENSPARARSLLILAREETGKASKLYDLASSAWSEGREMVALDARFVGLERMHNPKITASIEADEDLDPFWGDHSAYDDFDVETDDLGDWFRKKDLDRGAQAGVLNLQKQAGFYVDRAGHTITTPVGAEVGDMRLALIRAAQVAEMLLISDHTRMKDLPPEREDSTMDLQMRVMPYSHPDEFFEVFDKLGDDPADEPAPPPT